jgi:putative ABC transport system permease protein
LVVPLNGIDEKIAANAVAATGGVRSVSGLSNIFSGHFDGSRGPAWINQVQKGAVSLNYFYADTAFIPAMKIQLLAGMNFSRASGTGTGAGAAEQDVIINATAARHLGFKRYDDALGKKLWVDDSTALSIIGVVSDFGYENAGKPVDPLAFRNRAGACNYLYVAVDKGDKATIVSRIGNTLKPLAPSQTFTFTWLDEQVERISSQHATLSLLGYLAFMTLSIASLGLLGLVIYSVEIKRKEVSIRKVIGASGKQLVGILSRRFVKLLFIAGAIGLPIGYTLSFLFQLNFAVRPEYGFVSAMACFILLLSIGLFTIVSQTYKASRENPTKYLKVE